MCPRSAARDGLENKVHGHARVHVYLRCSLVCMSKAHLVPQLLDRTQLFHLLGGTMTRAAFSNWLWRKTRSEGFPRPIALGPNSVRWVADEVARWLASRPRSGPARSPNPRVRERAMLIGGDTDSNEAK